MRSTGSRQCTRFVVQSLKPQEKGESYDNQLFRFACSNPETYRKESFRTRLILKLYLNGNFGPTVLLRGLTL